MIPIDRPARSTFLHGSMAAAAAVAVPAIVRAADPVVVNVGASPIDPFAVVYYAKEQGYFDRAGLDVRIQNFFGGGGPGIPAAVLAGSLDIAIVDITALSSAHLRGIDFKVIAPAAIATPQTLTDQLTVAANSGITKGSDLNGKTIGLAALKSFQQVTAMAWVDKHSGDAKSLKFVEVPFPQMGLALTTGRVDAVQLTEPFLTLGKRDLRGLGDVFDGVANRFVFLAFFAANAWLQAHPAVASAFASAIHAAAVWANSHQTESGQILASASKMDPAVVATISRSTYGESLEPSLLQPVIDASAHYGVIEKKYPAADLIWQAPRR